MLQTPPQNRETPDNHTASGAAQLPQQAVQLAAEIWQAARQRETATDAQNASKVATLIKDPAAKQFTLTMVDEILRIKDDRRAAEHLQTVIQQNGIPAGFSFIDRTLLRVGAAAAVVAPSLVMPLIRKKVKAESSHVIISAEPQNLSGYQAQRKKAGWRVNLNLLGEAVLGQHEAGRRLAAYLQRLAQPDVHYVSVKLSSIYSHISLTGYAATLKELKTRLRQLYRAAMQHGDGAPKFINLDMEEYRDLHLTVDVFQAVLDEPEFQQLSAGIVLQAYLPDSFRVLQSLTRWAVERTQHGGGSIKVRLVKGANLAMEKVEASLQDWPQAPYGSKLETDANYKRMLEFAMQPQHAAAVRIGVASHNVFDIAYALLLSQHHGVEDRVDFEMLEGMANAEARELCDRTGDMLVYAPVCYDAEFDSAVAYLVRRFDENTQPGSFLRSSFALKVGSAAWRQQSELFLAACELASSPQLLAEPARTQNRSTERIAPPDASAPFENAANTDFSLAVNRDWLAGLVERCTSRTFGTLPLQVGGVEETTASLCDGQDPSRPGKVLYQYSTGAASHVEQALITACSAQPKWEQRGFAARAEILRQVAAVCANDRGKSIGVMMADAAKTAVEADTEISEAIDFANYYSRAFDDQGWFDGSTSTAAGVVVVTPPWNFPYAIPAGGCLAALMAGNTVILKPAPETVLTAWHLACQLWQAGVPKDVLQFLPLEDGENGKALISDKRVSVTVLTGAYATAQLFKSWRPQMQLFAETSGKNSLIITAAADLDLAIKDLVRGAFGHAGQKCSATSLAIVERSVYESPQFRNQLKDAASSLATGPAWNLSTDVTPLIRPPHPELLRGLTQLDDAESWLLEPQNLDNNPCLWSPGVRLGVKPGSWYHRTECFGPVLGLIPFDSLEEAMQIQNDNEFGLTAGIHSLDETETSRWRQVVEVGNAYINRSTTGAIVQRQPFGGWKNSSVGPAVKAGGPNYVAALRKWSNAGVPKHTATLPASLQRRVTAFAQMLQTDEQRQQFEAAAGSYTYWWRHHFSQQHDPSELHGETNVLRYQPLKFHCARLSDCAPLIDVLLCAVASHLTNVPLQISADTEPAWIAQVDRISRIEFHAESISQLHHRFASGRDGVLRFLGNETATPALHLLPASMRLVQSPCMLNGRHELQHFVQEQAISETVHRYGNLTNLP